MKKLASLFILGIFTLSACSIEPEAINYGKDTCHFCKMTIVDNQHAAELVTQKGKVSKYDAVECLINDLKKRDEAEVGMLLVNDYSQPGDLIEAETATYLISQGVPSPMGAFLSAFAKKEAAASLQAEKGGELYNWQEVRKQIK